MTPICITFLKKKISKNDNIGTFYKQNPPLSLPDFGVPVHLLLLFSCYYKSLIYIVLVVNNDPPGATSTILRIFN